MTLRGRKMKKGIRSRKFKRRLRNYILWGITILMMSVSILSCVLFAFGEPSWEQAVAFVIGELWCLAFTTANCGGVRHER